MQLHKKVAEQRPPRNNKQKMLQPNSLEVEALGRVRVNT